MLYELILFILIIFLGNLFFNGKLNTDEIKNKVFKIKKLFEEIYTTISHFSWN